MSNFPKHFVYSSHPTITGDRSQVPDSHNNLPPCIRRVPKEGFDEKVRQPLAIENHWLLKIMTLKVSREAKGARQQGRADEAGVAKMDRRRDGNRKN